jgi:hypothetical protein
MHDLALFICTLLTLSILSCSTATSDKVTSKQPGVNSISRIEMNLSALGVESDDFPSINATIDFVHNYSSCTKTYYDPAFKGSTYHLSKIESDKVLSLLQKVDLEKLNKHYHIQRPDQPTSTATIYTNNKTYFIEDYGLIGEYPLQEVYEIVYKP